MENRSVIDDLSFIVTPYCVSDAAGLDLSHIARHQPVDEVKAVGAGNPVFGHRRYIEHAATVANGEVLELYIIKAVGTAVSLPFVPTIEPVELCQSRVERRLEPVLWHLLNGRHAAFSLFRIARAALRPAAPLMPPPGCAPAPHR